MARNNPVKQEIKISYAEDARRMADQLIDQHHKHLLQAKIVYLFTNKRRTRCDRVVRGSAAKLDPVKRFFSSGAAASIEAGFDFLILLDVNEWQDLSEERRRRLVDHELCHCWLSDKGKWTLRGHDLEEFVEIIHRHGPIEPEDRDMAREMASQLHLMPDTVDRSPIPKDALADLSEQLGGLDLNPGGDQD